MKIQVRTRLRVDLDKQDIDLALQQGNQRLPATSRILSYYTDFFTTAPWDGTLKPISINREGFGVGERFFILFSSVEVQ